MKPGADQRAGDGPVLVVDDEPFVLETLSFLLGRRWRVLSASSAAEAREIMQRESVALVVTDNRMPGETGVELLGWVFRHHPDVTRVLVTGYTVADEIVRAINEGHVWRYVQKPWDNNRLREIVAEGLALRDRRLAQRRASQRYRDMFLGAALPMLRLDADGLILESNRAFANHLGYPADAGFVAQRFCDLCGDPEQWSALQQLMESGERVAGAPLVLRDLTARPRPLLVHGSVRIVETGPGGAAHELDLVLIPFED